MLQRVCIAIVGVSLGAGTAIGVAACGEERGDVKIEGGTTGTGKTTTGGSTTGETPTTPTATISTETTPEK